MRNLHGKVILISGASAGIGLATALACAKAGMNASLCGRDLPRLEEAAQTIRAACPEAPRRVLDLIFRIVATERSAGGGG